MLASIVILQWYAMSKGYLPKKRYICLFGDNSPAAKDPVPICALVCMTLLGNAYSSLKCFLYSNPRVVISYYMLYPSCRQNRQNQCRTIDELSGLVLNVRWSLRSDKSHYVTSHLIWVFFSVVLDTIIHLTLIDYLAWGFYIYLHKNVQWRVHTHTK